MYNTSASELELVANDLRQIARTYTNAAQQLDQQVVTLDGAVAHVLSDGVMPWKGLSSDAFVSAWLERQARLKQASTLMSQSAGYMTTMAQTIESNVPMVRSGQSIQLQPVFASMASNAQQAVLDEVSQAQNAIFMALAVLNSQLEEMAAEVSDCPQVDKEASSPGLYDNISRSDSGAGAADQTPEQRIKNEVGDAAIAEALIEQANQNGASLEDVAKLLEQKIAPDTIAKLINNNADLGDIATNVQALLDGKVKVELIDGWLNNGTRLTNAIAIMNQGVDLNLLGTSSQVGDFTGLTGASVNEVVSRIPADAKIEGWNSSTDGAKEGMKFTWVDANGARWRLRMHGPDPNPRLPPDANAKMGWVLRVQKGHFYMDAAGNFYKDKTLLMSNPNYDAVAANATHISVQAPVKGP